MSSNQFQEIWVHLEDGQTLCALINGARGWLMYLPRESDVGYSSRNLNYKGSPKSRVEFILNNGQKDDYPESWMLPTETVLKALEFFKSEKTRPTFIDWHDDSED